MSCGGGCSSSIDCSLTRCFSLANMAKKMKIESRASRGNSSRQKRSWPKKACVLQALQVKAMNMKEGEKIRRTPSWHQQDTYIYIKYSQLSSASRSTAVLNRSPGHPTVSRHTFRRREQGATSCVINKNIRSIIICTRARSLLGPHVIHAVEREGKSVLNYYIQ